MAIDEAHVNQRVQNIIDLKTSILQSKDNLKALQVLLQSYIPLCNFTAINTFIMRI